MSSDVQFDFEGSLPLARNLWTLADELAEVARYRKKLAENALTTWKGVHAKTFTTWQDDEEAGIESSVTQLRKAAVEWGKAYAKAVDEQNQVLRTRKISEINHERANRNILEDGYHAARDLLGFEESPLPREPPPCPVPGPPGFPKTAEPQLYW